MKAYLVINGNDLICNEDGSLKEIIPYKECYRVIVDRNKAIQYALSIGYRDPFGTGLSDEIGIATMYKAGEIDVFFMPIEIE